MTSEDRTVYEITSSGLGSCLPRSLCPPPGSVIGRQMIDPRNKGRRATALVGLTLSLRKIQGHTCLRDARSNLVYLIDHNRIIAQMNGAKSYY